MTEGARQSLLPLAKSQRTAATVAGPSMMARPVHRPACSDGRVLCVAPAPGHRAHPEETRKAARAAFPDGHPLHDAPGTIYEDATLAALLPTHGQPAAAPWRLALAQVLQWLEGLYHRLAWQCLLGLPLQNTGCAASAPSEPRSDDGVWAAFKGVEVQAGRVRQDGGEPRALSNLQRGRRCSAIVPCAPASSQQSLTSWKSRLFFGAFRPDAPRLGVKPCHAELAQPLS